MIQGGLGCSSADGQTDRQTDKLGVDVGTMHACIGGGECGLSLRHIVSHKSGLPWLASSRIAFMCMKGRES